MSLGRRIQSQLYKLENEGRVINKNERYVFYR